MHTHSMWSLPTFIMKLDGQAIARQVTNVPACRTQTGMQEQRKSMRTLRRLQRLLRRQGLKGKEQAA